MGDMSRGRTPEHVQVRFRRMKFEFEEKGFSKHWHAESPFISYFWASLSTAFPPGELFFMNAARMLRERIDDPRLQEEIAQFLLQEGHHTLQHRKFNRAVGGQGFEVEKYEKRFATILEKTARHLSPLGQLSVTVALEHFTAGLAHQYLGNPRIASGADPKVRALWAWHAAEEAEHKSTCFDLYQQLEGGYLRRVSLLPVAWTIILLITMRNLFDMLHKDHKLFNLGDNMKGFWYLFGKGGLITSMMPTFFKYFHVSFHPWDTDDSDLIALWQKMNKGYIINSTALAGSPTS